jgi:threonylcarbamoyladenosine tRNA methylthiotransferase MtaB
MREGTPAAKIPNQVDGNAIKERAARLRAAGATQVQRHLADQIGKTHHILMENPLMGRTEQFSEVSFATPQTEGALVTATITGLEGIQLTA